MPAPDRRDRRAGHEDDATYFLGRETLLVGAARGPRAVAEEAVRVPARNAQPATAYFGIPPDRVVELGMQITI